jgi:LysR family nitrogen assimilation transcriptional regulator
VELRQLRYFVKMVELRNMTRAASELHVAQSALSQQLSNLEASLGARLFDRSVQGLKPTQAGRLFYRHAQAILRQVEDSTHAIREEIMSPSGEVKVAMPASSARLIMVPLLQRIIAEYPSIRLKLMEHPSADVPGMLAQGEVDVAIAVDALPAKAYRVFPLLREDLFAVFPPSRDHASPTVELKELAEMPLVLPSSPNSIRSQLDTVFAKRRLSYTLVAEINVTSLLALGALGNIGVTILPWSAASEYVHLGQLVAKPIVKPALHRNLSLCIPSGMIPSNATQVVMKTIKDVCVEMTSTQAWWGIHMLGDELPAFDDPL